MTIDRRKVSCSLCQAFGFLRDRHCRHRSSLHRILRFHPFVEAGNNKLSENNMSLPVVRSLADCADASKTVLPYLTQLYDLPEQIYQNINNLQALKILYISTNPLITALSLSLFLAPIFLIVSEVNKNYSQVDRCWSILPSIYNAHYALYAHAAGLPTRRLDTLLLVSGIWSVRRMIAK